MLKSILHRAIVVGLSALLFTIPACGPSNPGVNIHGAGASFPAPLYQRWFVEYNKLRPEVRISYQSVGSGAGVNQFIAGTVQFGASDVPMTAGEIAKVSRGTKQIPVTAGGVVVGYNLPGVGELQLPRKVLADIFLGKVTKWNDPSIAAVNAGTNLPELPITVVHRSDGSGTTAIFTEHLATISADWKSTVKSGKSVQWPCGVGAKGNEGVTAQLLQVKGSIGYLEYGFAQQNGIATAALENKAGRFVKYTAQSAKAALNNIKLPDNFVASDSDPAGESSYPIVSYSWLLIYEQYDDAQAAAALRDVLGWILSDGQKLSDSLGYIPLPDSVVARLRPVVEQIGR